MYIPDSDDIYKGESQQIWRKNFYSIIINSMPKGVNNPNLTVAGAGAQLKIWLKLDTGNPSLLKRHVNQKIVIFADNDAWTCHHNLLTKGIQSWTQETHLFWNVMSTVRLQATNLFGHRKPISSDKASQPKGCRILQIMMPELTLS